MLTKALQPKSNKDFAKYEPQILQRAEIALRCAPFTIKVFADMAKQGVSLRSIAGHEGIKNQYLTRSANLIITENSLLWLIQVGVLRREVDGQGITDSFRLTPMGHFLLDKWQAQSGFSTASVGDRLQNFGRKFRYRDFCKAFPTTKAAYNAAFVVGRWNQKLIKSSFIKLSTSA